MVSEIFENLLRCSKLPKAARQPLASISWRRALRLVEVNGSRANRPACLGTVVTENTLRMVVGETLLLYGECI